MHQPRRLRLTASIILCFVLHVLGADKYTDENRPYEFGFEIDGQQHRHESKDKDGIVMGEFGFITADDVYHVTVYATDKEGRFKILSMKNIHLKSTPASSLGTFTSARQGHALALPPAQAASVQVSAVPHGAPVPHAASTTQISPKPQGAPTPQGTPALQKAFTPQGTPTPQPRTPYKPISIEPPGRSCSSCSLPTTTTRAPPPAYNQDTQNNNYNSPSHIAAPELSPQNQQAFLPSFPGQQKDVPSVVSRSSFNPQEGQPNYPSGQQNYLQQGLVAPAGSQIFTPQTSQVYSASPSYSQKPSAPNAPNNYAQQEGGLHPSSGQNQGGNGQQADLLHTNPIVKSSGGGDTGPYAGSGPTAFASTVPDAGDLGQVNSQQARIPGPNVQPSRPSTYQQGGTGGRTSKQYEGPAPQFDSKLVPNNPQSPGSTSGGQRDFVKPTLVSAQMQIVDKNTDIHALRPGEQEGLPPGLTKNDMTHLLYTFNYTLGFHGHFEEGYTNGVKKGYYFVTGRNGVRTRIDYVADDSGFHPKVSQEVLDLLSEDVPKPETEKDAKYGLKGSEFKWLYYPVDSKRR